MIALRIRDLRSDARVHLRAAERERPTLARAPGTTAPIIESAAARTYGRHMGRARALLGEAYDLEAGIAEPDWSAIEREAEETERDERADVAAWAADRGL